MRGCVLSRTRAMCPPHVRLKRRRQDYVREEKPLLIFIKLFIQAIRAHEKWVANKRIAYLFMRDCQSHVRAAQSAGGRLWTVAKIVTGGHGGPILRGARGIKIERLKFCPLTVTVSNKTCYAFIHKFEFEYIICNRYFLLYLREKLKN